MESEPDRRAGTAWKADRTINYSVSFDYSSLRQKRNIMQFKINYLTTDEEVLWIAIEADSPEGAIMAALDKNDGNTYIDNIQRIISIE
jgi:hypothetical protein